MSIKDRIKMFETMSAGSADTVPKKPHISTSTTVPQIKKETVHTNISNTTKPNNTHNTTEVNQPQDNVVLKPSDLKNKPNHVFSNMAKSQTVKPTTTQPPSWVKNKPIANSQPENPPKKVQAQKIQVETDKIAKPSDIRKKLNELANEKKIFFTPTVPQNEMKKTQSTTVFQQQSQKYQIQTDIPKISVKQNAQKFSSFYNSKSKPSEQPIVSNVSAENTQNIYNQGPIIQQSHQQKQKPNHNNQSNLNIPVTITYVPQTPHVTVQPQQPQPKPQPQYQAPPPPPTLPVYKEQTKVQPQTETDDTTTMLLRLKNKNKRKRLDFDDDQD